MLQSRSRRKTTTIEAIALHEAVSPDKWCVTYADLRYLRQQVISAIQQGLILSSPSSYGDDESKKSEDDDEFGPSIYVVNEQYIKPITAQAGKMSWALMMNPDGFGLPFVRQSCLARRHLWIPLKSSGVVALSR